MLQGYPIICMNESSFEAENVSPHGYATIGKSCIDHYNWQAKKRTNVISALYEKALLALDYFEKNINGHVFYDWCKYTLIPSLTRPYVIVMDNVTFISVFNDYSIDMIIVCYFYHPIVLI